MLGDENAEKLTPPTPELGLILEELISAGRFSFEITPAGSPFYRPLSWQEIMAWPGLYRSAMLHSEILAIRELSEIWATALNNSDTMDQPWGPQND